MWRICTTRVPEYHLNAFFEGILKLLAFYAERVISPFLDMTLHFPERTTPRNWKYRHLFLIWDQVYPFERWGNFSSLIFRSPSRLYVILPGTDQILEPLVKRSAKSKKVIFGNDCLCFLLVLHAVFCLDEKCFNFKQFCHLWHQMYFILFFYTNLSVICVQSFRRSQSFLVSTHELLAWITKYWCNQCCKSLLECSTEFWMFPAEKCKHPGMEVALKSDITVSFFW